MNAAVNLDKKFVLSRLGDATIDRTLQFAALNAEQKLKVILEMLAEFLAS
ncbi:hypothetical protein NHH88_05955 [Oxalobacteraceae bacterium OTU3CAMAD1]|nr:hypothetical protein NHH88_05955 [Oxalobacteraceae bacterium OTU3CAMAD1]